jgi:hypothetical protein
LYLDGIVLTKAGKQTFGLVHGAQEWNGHGDVGDVAGAKLIRIGAKVARHGRYVAFQIAGVESAGIPNITN